MDILIDTKRLNDIIAYLESKPLIEYTPYPQYDKRIYEVLSSLGFDNDYLLKHEELEDKNIYDMNLDDLRAMYTFIERGERFCDGCIAEYVENGTLLELTKRESILLENTNIEKANE